MPQPLFAYPLGSLGHSLYSPEQHCSWDDPHFENHFVTAFGHCAGEASPNNALGICNFEDQNCEDEAAEEPHLGMPPFMPYGRRGPDWLLPGGNWRSNFRPRGVANDHGSASWTRRHSAIGLWVWPNGHKRSFFWCFIKIKMLWISKVDWMD